MKGLLILCFLVVSSMSVTALGENVENIKLNKLINCKRSDTFISTIGKLLLMGENRNWIRSVSVTKIVKTMDTVSETAYPFKVLSDVYITPEGYLALVTIDPKDPNDRPRISLFSFQEFGTGEGFTLMANSLDISVKGSQVMLGDSPELTCDQIE